MLFKTDINITIIMLRKKDLVFYLNRLQKERIRHI